MRLSVFRGRHRTVSAAALMTAVFLFGFASLSMAASGEGQGAKGWVATDTYRVMNFIVLAAVLVYLLRKPISQGLNGRIRGIQDRLSELEAQKKQAENELARYNEKLARLDVEAEKIIADYVSQGKEAKARILKEAEAAAQKIEEQARRNIDREFETAKISLRSEVMEKALQRAERLIRDRITPDDQEKLVDDYLDKAVTR